MSIPPETPKPADTLPYAQARRSRPGILTAVAIMSIIVGGLSILMSLSSIASGVGFFIMSKAANFPMPTIATPAGPPTATMPTTSPAGAANSNQFTYFSMHTFPSSTTQPSAVFPFRPFHMDPAPAILTIIEAALSGCLAILLLAAGILLLLDRPVAGRLHWIFAVAKLPLAGLAAYAIWWLYSTMFSAFGTMSPAMSFMAQSMNSVAILEAVIFSSFGVIYPIALFIVLSTRTAKDYFSQLQKW